MLKAGQRVIISFITHAVPIFQMQGLLYLRSALSTSSCCPSPGSAGVARPFVGEPRSFCGELSPVFGGVSSFIGVMLPLEGTGILMSSGEAGMIAGGRF